MSLLDDARRLADLYAITDGRFVDHSPCYGSDCPHLALPRIMAALEAAERAVQEWGIPSRCPFCGPRLQRRPENNHDDICPWQALVAALRGDPS